MRYNTPEILINKDGQRYFKAKKYPPIPPAESDIYVVTVQGDRLDLLAYDYYNDAELWWIISIANEQLAQNSLIIPEGIQIRIPANPQGVLDIYNQINS
jgi:phage tail protein X